VKFVLVFTNSLILAVKLHVKLCLFLKISFSNSRLDYLRNALRM